MSRRRSAHAPDTARARPGPRRRFTPEQIADAVIEIGLASATLATVAERLGVTHAALYTYVGDRDGMIALAVDRVCAQTAWPRLGSDWRAGLDTEAWTWWHLCVGSPGFVEAVSVTQFRSVELNRRLALIGTWLRGHGFSVEAAVLAVDVVLDLVFDVAARVERYRHREHRPSQAEMQAFPPEVRETLHAVLSDEPAAWLAKKLRVVLAGIAAELAPSATSQARRARPRARARRGD